MKNYIYCELPDMAIERERKREWATEFKKYHSCSKCPFVKNSVDIGVGIQYDCDFICGKDVKDIVAEMESNERIGECE